MTTTTCYVIACQLNVTSIINITSSCSSMTLTVVVNVANNGRLTVSAALQRSVLTVYQMSC